MLSTPTTVVVAVALHYIAAMVHRFCIIGYGHIGKKHTQIIQQLPNAQLIAVCDSDQNKKVQFLGENPKIPFFSNWKEMFQQAPEAEVVAICLPNGLHAQAAIDAINAGKHVLIEKPICLTMAEGNSILEAAEKNQKFVWVVKQNRYSPPSQWMKKLVDSKKLGKILQIQVNCFWNRDERYYNQGPKTENNWRGSLQYDGGILFTQFSHFIDLLFWVFKDLQTEFASFQNLLHQNITEFPDQGTVVFRTKEGALGTLNVSINSWDKNMESSITVLAEKGSFRIGGQYMDKLEYCHIEGLPIPDLEPSPLPNQYGNYTGSAANHGLVYQNLILNLEGKSHESASAQEALKLISWIENLK